MKLHPSGAACLPDPLPNTDQNKCVNKSVNQQKRFRNDPLAPHENTSASSRPYFQPYSGSQILVWSATIHLQRSVGQSYYSLHILLLVISREVFEFKVPRASQVSAKLQNLTDYFFRVATISCAFLTPLPHRNSSVRKRTVIFEE